MVDFADELGRARRAAVVAMVALAAAVAILASAHGGPAYFLQLGAESPGLGKVHDVLGDDVPMPLADGHDGDRFWQLARDPFLVDDESLRTYLDRPVYRAQRIGYPLLASWWRLLGEEALLWGMVVTNIAAVGVGTYLTGRWSAERGGSGMVAYAFAFNPLAFLSVLFDLGDAVALAGLVGALYAFDRRRTSMVMPLAVIGALAKEPMLLGLGAAAVLVRGRTLVERAALVAPAAAAVVLWRLYVMVRLGADPEVQEFTPVPFDGYVEAWRRVWWPDGAWDSAVLSLSLLVVSVLVLALWARARRRIELAAAAPYAAMAPFFTVQVVGVWINIVRGVGPILTLLAVHLLGPRRTAEPTEPPTTAS